jgi:hypothetical protein
VNCAARSAGTCGGCGAGLVDNVAGEAHSSSTRHSLPKEAKSGGLHRCKDSMVVQQQFTRLGIKILAGNDLTGLKKLESL